MAAKNVLIQIEHIVLKVPAKALKKALLATHKTGKKIRDLL